MLHELNTRYNNTLAQYEALAPSLGFEELSETIRQREVEMEEPSFWDKNDKAQDLFRELNDLKSRRDTITNIQSLRDDIAAYFELLESEEDESELAQIDGMLKEFESAVQHLETERLLSGDYDAYDCIFSITAGAGGTDAQDWTDILLRMYCRYFEQQSLSYNIEDSSPGEEAGLKSVTITVKGRFAYGFLKNEIGVHRLVRLSPFNANNKRQTSFAAVDVIPDIPDSSSQLTIPADSLRVDTYRASGAGGQHVNKTSSAVRITHIPTGLVAQSQASRSQGANKEAAMSMLRSRLLQKMSQEHKETLEELSGASNDIAWGHQIRSYVFHPYQMVKDHRNSHETSQLQHVLDGALHEFVVAQLRHDATGS